LSLWISSSLAAPTNDIEAEMILNEYHPAIGYIPDGGLPPTRPRLAHSRVDEKSYVDRDISRFEANFRSFERRLDKLPDKGAVSTSPWPGDYWATYSGTLIPINA
jgi:hypothetical protein